MPTGERITLDPPEITSTRTEFDLTEFIDNEGIDWGSAEIETFMADKDRGSVPVDYRVPNREVSCGLRLVTRGTVTGQQARAKLQAKVGLFQKEGGWLKRVTNSGGTVFADIIDASLTATSVAGFESEADVDLDAHLELKLLPDFYEAEQTLADHTETTLPELIFTETSVDGDYPARCRIVVDEDDAENQRGLIWGLRNRHYSSATTARLAYNAEDLTAAGDASEIATSGASGGTAVGGTIWPVWTPLLSTNYGGTAFLIHTGSYRAYARCWSAGTVETSVRMKWDVNDLVNPVTNTAWTVPNPGGGTVAGTAFTIANLGELRLDPSPVGVHRWQGQVQAKTSAGNSQFRVDRLWFAPIDEGYGELRAPVVAGAADASLVAFDDFSSHAVGGTLSALMAPKGGNWDEAGDTADFKVYDGPYVARTVVDDADLNTGQYAILDGSATLSDIEVQADITISTWAANNLTGWRLMVLARYVDTSNWLAAGLTLLPADTNHYVRLIKRVAGATSILGIWNAGGLGAITKTIKLSVGSDGIASVYVYSGTDPGDAVITTSVDSHLATGGALDDGKVGIYDAVKFDSGSMVRKFQNFQALEGETPDAAVIYASQSAQLTTDGHYRLDTGGTAYGPVASVTGDLPRLPVSGMESRTTQVFLKASRGDLQDLEDGGIDDISARVYYQPSWLHVPE